MSDWIKLVGVFVTAQVAAAAAAYSSFHDWAPTPPMGWNSWDCYGAAVTEEIVLTNDEQITLMTLWCIARSPLFVGGNLPGNDERTLSLLTNDEVIAVDQHSEGNRQFCRHGDQIGWLARMPDSKDVCVALFNAAPSKGATQLAAVAVRLTDLGIHGRCGVRDLWLHKDLALAAETVTATIPSHGAVLYRLHPER